MKTFFKESGIGFILCGVCPKNRIDEIKSLFEVKKYWRTCYRTIPMQDSDDVFFYISVKSGRELRKKVKKMLGYEGQVLTEKEQRYLEARLMRRVLEGKIVLGVSY